MDGSFQELKCLYTNLQSLHSKRKEIELYLQENKVDLMFFTECWIAEDHHVSEYSFDGFQTVVCKKNRGGSCIYIRDHISYYEVDPPAKTNDSCWIVTSTKNDVKRLYGCVYRSPNSSQVNNENLLSNIIWAENNFNEVVILGDFNLPSINWNTFLSHELYGDRFLDVLNEVGLNQLISEPTRYRFNQNPSLLDQVLTNESDIECF